MGILLHSITRYTFSLVSAYPYRIVVWDNGRNNIYTYSLIHTYVWADTYIRAGSRVYTCRLTPPYV